MSNHHNKCKRNCKICEIRMSPVSFNINSIINSWRVRTMEPFAFRSVIENLSIPNQIKIFSTTERKEICLQSMSFECFSLLPEISTLDAVHFSFVRNVYSKWLELWDNSHIAHLYHIHVNQISKWLREQEDAQPRSFHILLTLTNVLVRQQMRAARMNKRNETRKNVCV